MVKLTDKTFIIGTISTLLLVALGIGFVGSRPSNTTSVVTTAEPLPLVRPDAAVRQGDPDSSVTVVAAETDSDAREQVADGTADAFLTRSRTWPMGVDLGVRAAPGLRDDAERGAHRHHHG